MIFGDFNNKPIPSTYYEFINDYDDDGTPIDAVLEHTKGFEDAFMLNVKDTNDKINTDDDDSLDSGVEPPPKTSVN